MLKIFIISPTKIFWIRHCVQSTLFLAVVLKRSNSLVRKETTQCSSLTIIIISIYIPGNFNSMTIRNLPNSVNNTGSNMTVMMMLMIELKVRFDWTRSNAKRRLATFANLREWSITSLAKVANLRESSRVVANLRDWSLHRLILITYF